MVSAHAPLQSFSNRPDLDPSLLLLEGRLQMEILFLYNFLPYPEQREHQ
jgi:hypothetical protein